MSALAILLLCVQACLVQTIYGQYIGGCGCGSASAISPIAAIGPAVTIGAPCGGSSYGSGAGLAGAYGVGLAGAYGAGSGGAYGAGVAPYGGAGEGNVAVIGELPVAGNTAVAGQVPIVGVVSFNGAAPAAGAVSIIGNCACECSY